ncbi:hypothetical protein J6590_066008 [Homalodisca vitripennis]|nr:hypothetical protein J6590_066008 [Homalodisca vitripennis]
MLLHAFARGPPQRRVTRVGVSCTYRDIPVKTGFRYLIPNSLGSGSDGQSLQREVGLGSLQPVSYGVGQWSENPCVSCTSGGTRTELAFSYPVLGLPCTGLRIWRNEELESAVGRGTRFIGIGRDLYAPQIGESHLTTGGGTLQPRTMRGELREG